MFGKFFVLEKNPAVFLLGQMPYICLTLRTEISFASKDELILFLTPLKWRLPRMKIWFGCSSLRCSTNLLGGNDSPQMGFVPVDSH